MCHVLGVKSNNYYSYQKRQANKPDDLAHQEMIELIKILLNLVTILMALDVLKKC